MTYTHRDFKKVPGVENAFYCPGCNSCADDATLPSKGCPCDSHGSGKGSLTLGQVISYLRDNAMWPG